MKLGLAHLTALDLPPADLARAARAHGFDEIGLRLVAATAGGAVYPLPAGSAAAVEFLRVAAGEGITVAEIEFVTLSPDLDVATLAPVLAAGAGIGARSLTVSGDDPDLSRLTDRFAALCDLASGFGMRVDLEFMRFRGTATLEAALAIVRGAGRGNGAVLLDTLHFDRSGGDVAALGAVEPGLIRSVQLSDAPMLRPADTPALIHEARTARLAPGEGALQLQAVLRALPGASISVEAPNDRRPLADRLEMAHAGALKVFAAARRETE